jgi:flagellar hook-length control protein FliK
MTQAFLGEDHSATMMSGPRTAQTVHLELPSHDSGPLSVRISMTDQTVHTQFTTDRSDLGQFLLTRQDQLQQNLTKSGLELGQFQVHIDYHGQQEAPPEWQSRRQGEAREDNRPPHQAEQQDQDRKQQHARSTQALSVFA